MKFVEALQRFLYDIQAQYGVEIPITKLGLSYEFYELVIRESMQDGLRYRLYDLCEPKILGIQLVPRDAKKDF